MKKILPIPIVILCLFLTVQAVMGHAELRSAVPAPGTTLNEQPGEIRLTFSEMVGPGSTIMIFGERFRAVEGIEIQLNAEKPAELIATLPNLEPGTYSVDWTVLSIDGHPASGSYTFAYLPELERSYVVGVILGTVAAVAVLSLTAWGIRRIIHRNQDSA